MVLDAYFGVARFGESFFSRYNDVATDMYTSVILKTLDKSSMLKNGVRVVTLRS